MNVEQVGRFERHQMPDGSEIFYEPEPHAYYGEVKASKQAKGGYSFVRDSRYTGVSTAVKTLDTNVDPLLHWAAKLDQIGVAELIHLTLQEDCPELDWLCDPKAIAAALRDAELTWADVRDRAATRGKNIHELILLALARGERPPSLAGLSAEERAYGQATMRWWRDRDPKPLYAEQVTISRHLRVAGRFDLLCEIDGERVLVDAKTREKGAVRRSDHAQLAGYELCNVTCGLGSSDRQLALILTPWAEYIEHPGLGTDQDFVNALAAYRSGSELEKRMRAAAKAIEQVAA